MKEATLKKTRIKVYIHENRKPGMSYNYDKVVVSKQPNSLYVFSVKLSDLEF